MQKKRPYCVEKAKLGGGVIVNYFKFKIKILNNLPLTL